MAADAATPLPLAAGTLSASLKAKPTSSASGSVSFAPAPSKTTRRPPLAATPSSSSNLSSSDYLSDKATTAFVRRTLCPKTPVRGVPPPIHDLLPPLTSRNDIDLQIYALLSVVLRDFVQNWYSKITPDETFVAEIVHVIAHCTRALEQRLRKVDLENLLLDQLPDLLNAHIQAYRLAHSPAVQSPLETDPRRIYHSLFPLPALEPVPEPGDPKTAQSQSDNEAAYRQLLVQGVMTTLLPSEDLENECLTALVGQIFSELIIGNLFINRLSEPWLIWEILCIAVRMSHQASTRSEDSRSTRPKHDRGWSIQPAFWSLVQYGFLFVNILRLAFTTLISSSSLPTRSWSSPVESDDGKPSGEQASSPSATAPTPRVPVADFRIWPCINNLLEMDTRMPWLSGLLSMVQWTAMTGPGRVARSDGVVDRLLSHQIHSRVLDPDLLPPLLRSIRAAVFPNNAPGAPNLIPPSSDKELRALRRSCANSLWSLVPKGVGRVYFGGITWPWTKSSKDHVRYGPLGSGVDEAQHPARPVGESKVPSEDRLELGSPSNASDSTARQKREQDGDGTKQARHSDAGRRDMSPDEQKRDDQGGGRASDHGDSEDVDDAIIAEIEAGILDVFSDAYCNKHLLYSVLELVLVRLMPELGERGVGSLWEDRLS